jgi:hypothetical protein
MQMEPSPAPEATRLTEPWRTSPTAKTPGRFVSSNKGCVPGEHVAPLVSDHRGREPLGEGLRANENEERRRRHGLELAGVAILELEALGATLAPSADHLDAIYSHVDAGMQADATSRVAGLFHS